MTSFIVIVTRIFGAISAVLLAALTALLGWHVFTRYVLRDPLVWGDEIMRFLVVGLTFTGLVYALGEQTHLRVDAIDGVIGPRVRRILDVVAHLLVGAGAVALIIGSYAYIARFASVPSAAAQIPRGVIYIPVLIALVMAVVITLLHAVRLLVRPEQEALSGDATAERGHLPEGGTDP